MLEENNFVLVLADSIALINLGGFFRDHGGKIFNQFLDGKRRKRKIGMSVSPASLDLGRTAAYEYQQVSLVIVPKPQLFILTFNAL